MSFSVLLQTTSKNTCGQGKLLPLWLIGILFFSGTIFPVTANAAKQQPATQQPYRVDNVTYYPIPSAKGYEKKGIASWYGPEFQGRRTSNGERYNMFTMTAAHKTLPMDTILLVKNLQNNKEVVVRVNDRGPFIDNRIIDLSYQAARQLHMIGSGTAQVKITALNKNDKRALPLKANKPSNYYIQVGSFSKARNARNLQRYFNNAGHTTIIENHSAQNTILYRVQVYAGRQLDRAQKTKIALEKMGYAKAFMLIR